MLEWWRHMPLFVAFVQGGAEVFSLLARLWEQILMRYSGVKSWLNQTVSTEGEG